MSEILKQSDYILDMLELCSAENLRVAMMPDTEKKKKLYLFARRKPNAPFEDLGLFAMDLVRRLGCSVIVEDEEDLADYKVKKLYNFPADKESLENDFKGIMFDISPVTRFTANNVAAHYEILDEAKQRLIEERTKKRKQVNTFFESQGKNPPVKKQNADRGTESPSPARDTVVNKEVSKNVPKVGM